MASSSAPTAQCIDVPQECSDLINKTVNLLIEEGVLTKEDIVCYIGVKWIARSSNGIKAVFKSMTSNPEPFTYANEIKL